MARIRPLTSNAVTGTGTITVTSGIFGGFDLNCDGTNTGTCLIRDTNASGTILFNSKSIIGKSVLAPVDCSGVIYYAVSGSGADAMLFEWGV